MTRRLRPTLDLHGAFLRRTDFAGVKLLNANLSDADFTGASFKGADFKDALIEGTILRGADLTGAVNLTDAQLDTAIIDEHTILPAAVERRAFGG